MPELEARVRQYWTERAESFALVRKNELHDAISGRWLAEMYKHLPEGRPLAILDAGCGTGYFSIILAKEGHNLTGIDFTPAMVEGAKKAAAEAGVQPQFFLMDASATSFPDESFDAVVTRNLTWTLPDPEKAYKEWFRVLKKGGILLNFDAPYADNVRNHNQKASYVTDKDVYGHVGITPALSRENAEITLAMPAGYHHRPIWDLLLAERAGFAVFGSDKSAGERILREKDLPDAPLFLVWAEK